MMRWMCGSKPEDRVPTSSLRTKLGGVPPITDQVRRSRLRWFGHVERRDEDDWLRKACNLDIGGKVPKGRPRQTWGQNYIPRTSLSGTRHLCLPNLCLKNRLPPYIRFCPIHELSVGRQKRLFDVVSENRNLLKKRIQITPDTLSSFTFSGNSLTTCQILYPI